MKEDLIERIVVESYGENECWVVEDVVFDVDLTKTCLPDQTTIVEHYKNYGMQIRSSGQPVIISLKNQSYTYLLP